MSNLCCAVTAWPSSSNAITTTAAPYARHRRAWRTNSASPTLSEIEFTIDLPWQQRRPASTTLKSLLSTMMGTRAMSGSLAMRFKKRVMAAAESSMPSSMFTSSICAPFSTWSRATAIAASYLSFLMRLAKRREPVTLQRSPTLTKLMLSPNTNSSMPLKREYGSRRGAARGLQSATASRMAAMCGAVVPQQPPMMLTRPAAAKARMAVAMSAGDRS
mmetsp:Transcript_37936/g.93037  ORF Transcript_37936/g.93037 Transcript_37936/m.93037 type:complete len:217 (-) Transcript_37936:214-864(-)